jgi:hypothetical protein
MTCELSKHSQNAGRLDFAHGAKSCNVAEIIDIVGAVCSMLNLQTICNSRETGSSECGSCYRFKATRSLKRKAPGLSGRCKPGTGG